MVETAEEAPAAVTAALAETGEERARPARTVYEEPRGMPGWTSLFERVSRLEVRVAASEKRHQAAPREQEDKTSAYEGDPFFAYLSRRRFGTAAAAGNPLTRRLDRWVAGVTDYEAVRQRYDLLKAPPGHAASVLDEDRKALAVAAPPLAALEDEVIARNGMTPVLERGERLYAEREEGRKALREAETGLRALTDELAALHDERGSYCERAIDGIEGYLEGHSLRDLVVMAQSTDDPRDDVLVAGPGDLDARLSDLRARLAKRREERSELSSRLAGLEDLRDRFEEDDWNGGRSRFDDGLDLNSLLLGFLAGRHSPGHVHRVLSRNQSFLPVGGGGFGGGGFGTGGGFGGGGFSTGGGL